MAGQRDPQLRDWAMQAQALMDPDQRGDKPCCDLCGENVGKGEYCFELGDRVYCEECAERGKRRTEYL